MVNKYGVKCGTSLRFCENKGWLNSIDSYGWFQWYFRYWLDRRSLDDKRKITRWKRIVNRFKGKLIKMIKLLMVDLMTILFQLEAKREHGRNKYKNMKEEAS